MKHPNLRLNLKNKQNFKKMQLPGWQRLRGSYNSNFLVKESIIFKKKKKKVLVASFTYFIHTPINLRWNLTSKIEI